MDRLSTLQILVAVMEAGSFSAAAKRLGLGQPAVSKSVAQLERHLGTRLFVRTTRGLNPTGPARLYYEHARQALLHVDEAELAARGEGAALAGVLRVSSPVTFTRMQIIPRLGPFLAAHPGLALDIVLDDRHVDLLREGVDMALRVGSLDDSSMTARRLARSRRVVLASARYIERHGVPREPADLARHAFVIYTQSRTPRSLKLRRGEESVQVPLDGRLTVSAAEGLREAVLAGLGMASISTWVFAEELARGEVVEVLGDWSQPPVDAWAVYPSGHLPSAKARAFADYVEQLLAPDAVAHGDIDSERPRRRP
ncbi:LysR family transcriptional regulator [Frateuria defendens]|uniref:LysR family transcriptional regulator n=1 Tax=Frateuria defendens TaxID=2219559 RepID=UPI00066FF772|nr:LysR family transcriptional regulator [Frateuria defendens]